MVSCFPTPPPFKQRGCCSLWHQLLQTALWLCGKINISARTDQKSHQSYYLKLTCPKQIEISRHCWSEVTFARLVEVEVWLESLDGCEPLTPTRTPPSPKHPSVSVAYGNHAVMNCCLLCSLQGAQLNIPQRICHTVVLHTETCSSFDIHKNVCIDKRVPSMLHNWPVWQVTMRLNNVT